MNVRLFRCCYAALTAHFASLAVLYAAAPRRAVREFSRVNEALGGMALAPPDVAPWRNATVCGMAALAVMAGLLLVDPVRHAAVLWPAVTFKGLNAMLWFWYAATTEGMPVFAVAGVFDVAVVTLMIVLARRAGDATRDQPPADGWLTFERRWRDTLVETSVPGGAGTAAGTRVPATFWQDAAEWTPPAARRGLRLAVWVLTLSPVVYARRPALMGTLPQSQRERCLERAARSRSALVRELVGAVRLMACVALFDGGSTRREAGRR